MKYLKKFNENRYGSSFQNSRPDLKQSKLMDEYLWLPLFCISSRSLDCKIFTDKNLGGYGLGIRGDFFGEDDFKRAISKKGDCLGRKLYTASDVDILIKDLGLDNMSKEEAVDAIVDMISNTRKAYSSADPDWERENSTYIELDEIKDLLL